MPRVTDMRQVKCRTISIHGLFKPREDRVVTLLVESDVARNDLKRRIDQRVAAADDMVDQRGIFDGIVVGESGSEEDHRSRGRGPRRSKDVNVLVVVERAGKFFVRDRKGPVRAVARLNRLERGLSLSDGTQHEGE